MEKKKNEKSIIDDVKFINKSGKEILLSSVIDKTKDCWMLKGQKGKEVWILSHKAVEKIADIAGISKNFDVEESSHIVPDIKNEHEHIVRVTIHCKAGKNSSNECCWHSDENYLTITGEANRVNTPHRGAGYLRKMAEKRAYDIAVLKHLGLYSSIFSEEESEDFRNDEEKKHDTRILPGTKEFELIVEDINVVVNSTDKAKLKEAGKKIKQGIKDNKYSEKQLIYLRELFNRQTGKLNQIF